MYNMQQIHFQQLQMMQQMQMSMPAPSVAPADDDVPAPSVAQDPADDSGHEVEPAEEAEQDEDPADFAIDDSEPEMVRPPKKVAKLKMKAKARPKPTEWLADPPPQPAAAEPLREYDVIHVQIHTFGTEPMEVDYFAGPEEIIARYREIFGIELNMLLDARKPFQYPRCRWGHNGHHDAFVAGMVGNPRSADWLKDFKDTFDAEHKFNPRDKVLELGIFCKQGINRSVGASLIVEYILDRHGYDVAPVIHRSRQIWADRGFCSSGCDTCRNGAQATPKKVWALWKAFKTWNRL